ncbi:hypothetical protein KHA80_00045 [Anaerobacillus sp. HL2]|nr:hypothetical protein KHA80_00045 [Anaerobacillus sp. HL2]
MVLFFLLALMEDCGYMARVAVVMDRIFKRVGLSGRSIIPMVTSTACGIPGVMATRTIKTKDKEEQLRHVNTFLCSVWELNFPVIALFAW